MCFMTAIAVFGAMHVAANLFIRALVLPLLSSLHRLRSQEYPLVIFENNQLVCV